MEWHSPADMLDTGFVLPSQFTLYLGGSQALQGFQLQSSTEFDIKGGNWGVHLLMQLLKVRGQVVNALSIQELPDDIRGLQVADG